MQLGDQTAERLTASPLLRPARFASRGFTAAGLAAAAALFSIVGTVFTLSLLFAHQGAPDLQIAALLGCLFAANALASLVAARAQARFGASSVLVAGLTVAASGDGRGGGHDQTATEADHHQPPRVLASPPPGLVVASSAVSAVPRELAGMAGAANNALRQVGAALGAAVDFADLLATTRPARVLTPTHPGFGGTPRPDGLASITSLAAAYVALLDELDLTDVTVVGNSLGGWTAAEIVLLASPRISSVVLVDAVGLDSTVDPIADFFALTMDEVTSLSYADPERFRAEVTALPAATQLSMAGNRESLLAYGGTTMADPTLLGRLPAVAHPVLVVWGRADRISAPSHGRAYAAAIPGARFAMIDDAGHLPQLETPERLAEDVWAFADEHATNRPG